MQPNTIYYELTASAFDWKIADHKTIKALGFNNTVPGPVLKAKKGDTLNIKFKNELDEPTIVHWHGLRVPASMDGNGEDQPPVLPGESFEYQFTVPDAGTFWYHAHHNETEQMERGMYGAVIVEDDSDPVTDGDRIFMIDDMKLTSSNDFYKGGLLKRWMERHDGREGDTLLINGKEDMVVNMHAATTERWRFINASSARYFRLYMGGKNFKLIATDGGLIEQPVEIPEVMITPGERIDILAGPFEEGESFQIESLPYNRMTFVKSARKTFARVQVLAAKASLANIPANLVNIEPLLTPGAKVNRRIKLSVGPSLKRGIDFLVNNERHHHDKPVYVGDLQVWEVSNTSLMDHPFHLHGFFFQVIEENGKPVNYRAWKDTVNLKPRSKVKIAWMPDNRPGQWMYHCHILEHHAAGMMGHFEVINKMDKKKQPSPHTHSMHHTHSM
jgi:FtsP/CotA-like multicopper oxidase with cupredoxin domain